MTEIEELRRQLLNSFCVKKGWISPKDPKRGSPGKLADLLGRTSSFWSDRLGGARPIKAELAREIEEALGGDMDRYFLDGGVSGKGADDLVDLVEKGVQERDIPSHVRESIQLLILSSPKKK